MTGKRWWCVERWKGGRWSFAGRVLTDRPGSAEEAVATYRRMAALPHPEPLRAHQAKGGERMGPKKKRKGC